MDQTFERCKGAIPIADDIQGFGTDNSHDMHLHEAMEGVREAGIKLNFKKCVIKSKQHTFFGYVYTPQRVTLDIKKVEAIKKMEAAQTKQELQSFLAMINYLGQYIKNMAELKEISGSCLEKMFIAVDAEP